jgi:hypothetical protein
MFPMPKERELYRHNFYDPVHIDLRGLWIDDELTPGFSLHEFKVMNISGSGMNFQSNLDFPHGKKVNVQFAIKLDVEHLLKGQVVRREKITDGIYSYAVKFNITTGDQIKLIRSINLLQLKRNNFKKD